MITNKDFLIKIAKEKINFDIDQRSTMRNIENVVKIFNLSVNLF